MKNITINLIGQRVLASVLEEHKNFNPRHSNINQVVCCVMRYTYNVFIRTCNNFFEYIFDRLESMLETLLII